MDTYNPWLYQRESIAFLLDNPHSGLFLDPGLGKTSITLAAIHTLKRLNRIRGSLVIAPLRVVQLVWPNELSKWRNFSSLSYATLHGPNKNAALFGPKKDIYFINPEGLNWLYYTLAKNQDNIPFDSLWIDESTKFKSPSSKRFGMLSDMLPLFKRRHILTGTPAPRGMLDLWAQIYVLDAGNSLETQFNHFRNRYFSPDDYVAYRYNIDDGADKRIHRLIAPLVLEMSSKDHLEMPELVYNNIAIKLPGKAQKIYDQMEEDFFVSLDSGNELSAAQSAQASMKCHQIANGMVYHDWPIDESGEPIKTGKRGITYVHSQKITALEDLVDELAGKPLLVAYHYKHDLAALLKHFGKDTPYIGSGVSQKRAKEIEKEWNAGNLPLLFGHPMSMAHGLNMQQSGNDICWYSVTWNLEHYMQFIARIWRQGVTGKMVRCHHIVAENTVDFAMLTRLGERAKDQADLRLSLAAYRRQKLLAK